MSGMTAPHFFLSQRKCFSVPTNLHYTQLTPMPALTQPDSSLTEQVVRLQALLEASRVVHSTIQLAEVLRIAARIAVLELELEGALFTTPQTIYGELPAHTASLPRFDLLSREGALLTELIVSPPGGRELSLYERDFLEGLTLQTAVAVENAINHERHLEYARLARDLDAARAIQRSLLPQAMPLLRGYSLAARSRACYEVGGDYLDVVTEPNGGQLMVVADVAGKGMASALIGATFRSAFRTLAHQSLTLRELAERLSQQHYEEGDEARRRYVTAIFLRLDPATGDIEFVNAGHNPGFLLSPAGEAMRIKASGTPLGMLPGARYTVERANLAPGARILLYTDGLTEVFRGTGDDQEEFGEDRLLQTFIGTQSPSAEATLDTLWQTLDTFAQGAHQGDDMSALTLFRLPSPGAP